MNDQNLKPWKKGHSGNPVGVSKTRLAYRKALEKAVLVKDFKQVAKKLVEKAKQGEPWAVREFFDLTLGKDRSITVSLYGDGEDFGENALAQVVDIYEVLKECGIPEKKAREIQDAIDDQQFPGRGFKKKKEIASAPLEKPRSSKTKSKRKRRPKTKPKHKTATATRRN